MDIRNFFGGGGGKKPASTPASTQSTEDKPSKKSKHSSNKSQPIVVEDELDDSDFEDSDNKHKPNSSAEVSKKRRLKSKREVEMEKKAKKETKLVSSPPPPAAKKTTTTPQSSTKSVEPVTKKVVDMVEAKSPVKKSSNTRTNKIASPTKTVKRKEVSGGASAFFGIPSTSSNSPSEKTVTDDATSRLNTPTKRSSTRLKTTPTPDYSPHSSRKSKERSENMPEAKDTSSKDVKRARVEVMVEPAPAVALTVLQAFAFAEQQTSQGKYMTVTLKQRVDELIHTGSSGKSSQCLAGLKVAFTGVMERFVSRESLQDLYLSHGAKVVASVSGNTHFLMAADEYLEDMRPVSSGRKHQQAVEREIPILSEKTAVSLLLYAIDTSSSSSNTSANTSSTDVTSTVTGSSMSAARAKAINTAYDAGSAVEKSNLARTQSASSSRGTTSSSSSSSSGKPSLHPPSRTVSASAGYKAGERPAPPPAKDDSELLWVDKYKPSKLEDVIGGTENIKKLVDWLKRWDAVHIKKTQRVAFTKENPGAKAVLISGPPGIGKTTLATLIATTMGYEVMELNASDARSKSAIEEQVKDVVMSRALSMTGAVKRRLVIMDEVDGMGGSDRGGIPELIKVIKIAKNPIICLCNDRQAMKIKSLAGHCFDIRLRRPTKASVAQRLVQIGRQEGLMIESNAAEMLVEQMGNDIRQCINAAQMWKAQSNVMRYFDLRAPPPSTYAPASGTTTGSSSDTDGGRLKSIEKDKILRQSPFDACGMILGGHKTDFNERYNSFFIDYSLVPLLVQQNYVDSSQAGISRMPGKDAVDKLDLLSKAADSVSEMDLIGSKVMGNDQHWELLPAQAALSLRVGSTVQGYQSFPTFPQWLGKNSTTNKNKRLTQELVVHTLLKAHQGFESMRMEYNCYLKFIMTKVLRQYGTGDIPPKEDGKTHSGVCEVVDILDSYGLSREDLMDTMQQLQFVVSSDAQLQDHFGFLDSKLKSAFTREYNSRAHRCQGLVENMDVKKKRRTAAADEDEEGTTEDLGATKVDDGIDSDEELEAFMKKHAKKGKGKAKTAGKKGATKAKKK